MAQDSEEDVTVCGLIEMQRRLADSHDLFERLLGTLWVAGMLDIRLAQLTDRQIGQLMFDLVGDQFCVLQPEMTICTQATRRLFRSAAGSLTTVDIESQRQRPACPKCGNELLFHYGVGERNFLECVLLSCGHKEYVSADQERDTDSGVDRNAPKEHLSHPNRLHR